MTREKELEDRIQRAVELFMQGYGCCQSVVCAFTDLYGLDEEMALKVSAGFGGGVGRMRMMCGACSALVILAGLERGQTRGEDREGKAVCYQLVRQLLETFRQRNGSIICAELLQMNGVKAETNTSQPDERNAEYYRVRPCARKVESAARVFAEYLASSKTSRKEGKTLA
jgi:C_GCAxxG_C_C family probable redox protein